MRPDDAKRAVADAVGDQVEVLLDGGIRRGGDVVKALALGARAVMIGRAYLWGMAAGGEQGVANVLQIMRSGVDEALLGLGRLGPGRLRGEGPRSDPSRGVERHPADRADLHRLAVGAGVHHLALAHVDADVAHRPVEEHQITRL